MTTKSRQTSKSMFHDPSARLDYTWDWAPWLAEGEVITAHTVTVLPPDEMVINPVIASDTTVIAWAQGGDLNATYQVTCHVVTSAGREDDRMYNLTVRDR